MKPQTELLISLCALGFVQFLPSPLHACSMVACLGDGSELRSSFVVRITQDDRPLAGVSVQITHVTNGQVVEVFSGRTATNGKAGIRQLPAGNYWVSADLLGVFAGSECFHVGQVSSRAAKKQISFEWGESPPEVRKASGKLVYTKAGQGDNLVWNITHRVQTPITNARLSLRSPSSSEVYNTMSDADGRFTFGEMPDGIYVLRVEGASAEPANLLFRVSNAARQKNLFVGESDPIGGSCGGWSVEPDYAGGS